MVREVIKEFDMPEQHEKDYGFLTRRKSLLHIKNNLLLIEKFKCNSKGIKKNKIILKY